LFENLAGYLHAGDLLVVNNSKVLRARLRGQRATTGGAVELLLLERQPASRPGTDSWLAMARPAKKLQVGERLQFGGGSLVAEVQEVLAEGERVIQFQTPDLLPLLDGIGELPLPPYIIQRRKQTHLDPAAPEDADRYQTVYAQHPGSVAAPTAGLHFTEQILRELCGKGIERAEVTLHVGAGTFKPVEVEDPAVHPMHREYYTVPQQAADAVQRARRDNRRVLAVGTTVVRTLESAYDSTGKSLHTGSRSTNMLILPGYQFQVVGALLTNFHLPRSTLLMLVSAFAGTELIRAAYAEAIREQYRFYSYGDAMLIV